MIFSGSTLERVAACPGSQALPHVAEPSNEAADKGTAIHGFLSRVLSDGRDAALLATPQEWRGVCEAIRVEELPHVSPEGYACEVAFVYDLATGRAREVGRNIGRQYPQLRETEVATTCDLVALTADGVFVGDVKTGRTRVTAARDNWQLALGALAAASAYGRSSAEVAIVYVREDSDPWFDRATFDELDLADWASRVRQVAARVEEARTHVALGNQPSLTLGDHCKWCPARRTCPAQTAMIHSIASSPVGFANDLRSELTPALARKAYETWRTAVDALKRAGEAIYGYAMEHPIDLGDGIVFGPKTSDREFVRGDVARAVLLEMHGAKVADDACTFASSKSGIRDALRRVAQETGAKLAHLEREALERIEKAGGIDRRVVTQCKEYRPKRDPNG